MKDIRLLIGYRFLHGEDRCEADRLKLEAWLEESEEHQHLYRQLMDPQNWTDWKENRENIDIGLYWRQVERRTLSRRRVVLRRRLLGVAACVTFLLGIGMLWVFRSSMPETPVEMTNLILPGSSRARLIFSDGKSIALDACLSPDRVIEQDGALIRTDSSGVHYIPNQTEKETEALHTLFVPKGGEYILKLAEGTVVHLNSQSVLEYPAHFAKDKREVYLEGEAFFRVEHTENIPFIVHTRSMDIHVTGTEFNVRAYQDEVKVQATLSKGKVDIGIGKEKYSLLPAQQAELDLQTMATQIHQVDPEDYLAWTKGWFVFKGQRLEDIMNELARWYDFEVFYQNPEVADMIFGGKLNREGSIEPILKVMEATLTLQIHIQGKTIVFQFK